MTAEQNNHLTFPFQKCSLDDPDADDATLIQTVRLNVTARLNDAAASRYKFDQSLIDLIKECNAIATRLGYPAFVSPEELMKLQSQRVDNAAEPNKA